MSLVQWTINIVYRFVCVYSSLDCSVLCMRTLLKLLHYHVIYKDVFREIGLIEVMVTCLQRYAALLKDVDTGSGTDGCYYWFCFYV